MKFKDLPNFSAGDLNSPAAMARKLNQMSETLQLIIGTRGEGKGNPAWYTTLIESGLIDSDGSASSQTPGITHLFVAWTAPTYAQGGGNAYTTIWGATYDTTVGGDLPTFGDAVKLGTVPYGTEVYAHPTEPNVQWHIWITFTTYANKRSSPAGGTNGVSATSGQLDGAQHIEALTVTNALIANLAVDDAKVANLSAGKLTAGSIAVGAYIQSSGFVSGSEGWRINGDGSAELSGIIVRGTIYASAGNIGGAVISGNNVASSNYDGAGTGWMLHNTTGKILAGSVNISNVGASRVLNTEATAAQVVLKVDDAIEIRANGTAKLGSLQVTGHIRAGQTDYNTGTGFWYGLVGTTPMASLGKPAGPYFLFDGTDIFIKAPSFDAFEAAISGGTISDDLEAHLDPVANRTVSVTGGKAPYRYQWQFVRTYANGPGVVVLTNSTTATVSLGFLGTFAGESVRGRLVCNVLDTNGRMTSAAVSVVISCLYTPGSGEEVGGAD